MQDLALKPYTQQQYEIVAGMQFNNMDLSEFGEYVIPDYKAAWASLNVDDVEEIFRRAKEYGYYNNLESFGMDDIAERCNNDFCHALN